MAGFAIDLQGFAELLAEFRVDVEQGLVPSTRHMIAPESHRIAFGLRNPSGEVVAAHRAIEDAARMFAANVVVHVANAEVLFNAGTTVLADYEAVELLASALSSRAVLASATVAPAADEMTTASPSGPVSAMLIGPLPALETPPPLEYETFCLNW